MGSGFRFRAHLDGFHWSARVATGPKNLGRGRDGLVAAYAELRLSRHGQDHHRFATLTRSTRPWVGVSETSTRTTSRLRLHRSRP